MARVAVPDRIASCDMTDAAPGHRFYLYLEHWEERTYKAGKAKDSLKPLLRLPSHSVGTLAGIRDRQKALIAHYRTNAMSVSTISTAPFATGLGNEHPIENGFAFLTPYGLPYLAGSGVKGILRRSMQELHKDGEEGFTDEATNTLFGPEKIDKPEDAQRGALDFWDVFPNPAGDKMVVEIMTPHFGKYYRREDTPHDSGAPVPVSFLAVPAGSAFDFHVVCQSSRLSDALQATWKDLLDRAFRHAFEWVGFGAKTSVGYGAMKEDPSTVKLREAQKQKALADAEAAERALRISSMSPLDQFIENEMAARQDKNQSKLAFFFNKMKQQTAVPGEFRLDIAKMLQMLMKDAKKWKEKSEKKNPEKDGDFQDTLKVKAWLTSK